MADAIDADPDGDGKLAFGHFAFDQDAGELPVGVEHVIGPFECQTIAKIAGALDNRVIHGKARDKGQLRRGLGRRRVEQ